MLGLVSFGRAPLSFSHGDAGMYFRIQLLPIISWIGAIYAVIFMIRQWKVIVHAPATAKVLGVLGSLILVGNALCSILFLSLVLLGTLPPGGAATTGGRAPMVETGDETWVIDGVEYPINSTYFLDLNGEFQYTIEYQYPGAANIHSEDEALKVAFPIMAHAYTNKRYDRFTARVGADRVKATRIGVALFERKGIQSRGYRVALTLNEIETRLKETTPQSEASDI
jgi:hypothetical protein